MSENLHPEQLFELFYQDLTPDMNPPGMVKHRSEGMFMWWRERFMNALNGIEEPMALRSWAEAPQMWLKGYKRGTQGNNPE
ncbi:hypothetical protein BS636_10260 [Acinetobacter sp. LoGeW2-3]|uniref:hypothetical protein n=1 Tax=Acinetobacter sp. LoGeW2-3 TaxID=1808001 RepID=UPI000C059C27|nr:hypothetical protein [Acinetobacter sp. LoGeW2-3]ATO20010.1 hypothetical protein BS636_10260 [Acinetobacter sp. LoGeW2-3]